MSFYLLSLPYFCLETKVTKIQGCKLLLWFSGGLDSPRDTSRATVQAGAGFCIAPQACAGILTLKTNKSNLRPLRRYAAGVCSEGEVFNFASD
jgi:hypothetical protein